MQNANLKELKKYPSTVLNVRLCVVCDKEHGLTECWPNDPENTGKHSWWIYECHNAGRLAMTFLVLEESIPALRRHGSQKLRVTTYPGVEV